MSLDDSLERTEGFYFENNLIDSSKEGFDLITSDPKQTNFLIEKSSIEDIVVDKNQSLENDVEDELEEYEPPNKPTTPGAGLWLFCETCKQMLFIKHIKLRVCPGCNHHFRMRSTERIEMLIDEDTWDPINEDMMPVDMVELATDSYKDRLEEEQEWAGMPDAVQTGFGELRGIPVALAVMDFEFLGGSMGSVVGEKITRLIELATFYKLPVILVCASGGARMQEGALSLMQMAKISSALRVHQLINKLMCISILTSPTTGGVTASFGMLGDLIIAEPGAYIAFAGKRVIEQIYKVEVDEQRQRAENVFDHGMIDLIIPRTILRDCIWELFQLYLSAPCKLQMNFPLSKNDPESKDKQFYLNSIDENEPKL
uniref:Acetyl-coenzyme A carboxylase carboxyl transferase subunit beta, chloroplastic n=1 Tax=Spirogyra maxima TaxID=3180 RepID=A0A191T4D3_SPIMX|nr:beta subunit of acetyl-CoA carboxylase carboxytransferase [Spirogyra maxima]ANI25249.1 beta subunit of acetyl-CoA carboxylase carboxytransferase [Spirogyra maxima]